MRMSESRRYTRLTLCSASPVVVYLRAPAAYFQRKCARNVRQSIEHSMYLCSTSRSRRWRCHHDDVLYTDVLLSTESHINNGLIFFSIRRDLMERTLSSRCPFIRRDRLGDAQAGRPNRSLNWLSSMNNNRSCSRPSALTHRRLGRVVFQRCKKRREAVLNSNSELHRRAQDTALRHLLLCAAVH